MSNTQFTDEVINARINAKQLGFPADEAYEEVYKKYAEEYKKVDAEEKEVDKLGPEM